MTCHEAITLIPFASKVRVKSTGNILIVRLKHKNNDNSILLKLDDGTWYTNDEVEFV